MEGGEAGGVGYAGRVEEGREDCLEAGCARGGEAGVAVFVGGFLEGEVGRRWAGCGSEGPELGGVGGVAEGCADVEGWGDVCVEV